MELPFQNTYARLPDSFHEKVKPTPVLQPFLIAANEELARELDLDAEALHSPEALAIFSGNTIPEAAEPIAMAYAGHQFANFVPLLGDGRAILLGEVNGRDIQLKGAGRTPFSRRGDGRSALGPVLREYLVSEAMHALGIPTTRALMAIGSGELVLREEAEKSGIFTRVANSHLRIGTAQYFAGQRNEAGLQQLVDYANQRLYPENEDALDLLRSVISKQARLVAQWMSVGFIHGVMNTDNMSFSGETIDYGPCAFMDYFNPAQVYSYIDQGGRYSYQNQPGIAQWNLVRLAEALLPLFDPNHDRAVELAKAELEKYPDLYESHHLEIFSRKLGHPGQIDAAFIREFFDLMAAQKTDFTLTFRHLAKGPDAFLALFKDGPPAREWLARWQALGTADTALMDSMNPAFIPRNHRIEEVIEAAKKGEFKPFHELHRILSLPYEEQPEFEKYSRPPKPEEVVCNTFCGT
ncbi:MAG: protein adenylyltransferase SelO [Akkermansiaceae bacterium]